MTPARSRQRGFTIMEILIATAILVVGLLSIIALFPVAMDMGNKAMEETTAVQIARSVEQALREGLAHRKGQSTDGKWTYFLFQHDGVLNELPRDVSEAVPEADYYILLPDVDTEDVGREIPRSTTSKPLFLYPEDDGTSWVQYTPTGLQQQESDNPRARPNGGGNPQNADDDSDDNANGDGYVVQRVYQMGAAKLRDRQEGDAGYDDPIYQYSFAFTLRRAYHDPSLGRQALSESTLVPSSELFECEILVFRSFIRGSGAYAKPFFQTKIYLEK